MFKYAFLSALVLVSCGQNVAGGATDTETGGAVAGVVRDSSGVVLSRGVLQLVDFASMQVIDSAVLSTTGEFQLHTSKNLHARLVWKKSDSLQWVIGPGLELQGGVQRTHLQLDLRHSQILYAIPYQVWLSQADRNLANWPQIQDSILGQLQWINVLLNQSQNRVLWNHYVAEWKFQNVLDSTLLQTSMGASTRRLVFLRQPQSKYGNWNSGQKTIWMQPYSTEPGILPLNVDYTGQLMYLIGLSRGAPSLFSWEISAQQNHLDNLPYSGTASVMKNVNLQGWDDLSLKMMEIQGVRDKWDPRDWSMVFAPLLKLRFVDSAQNPVQNLQLSWYQVSPAIGQVPALPSFVDHCAQGVCSYNDTLFVKSQNWIAFLYRLKVCNDKGTCRFYWLSAEDLLRQSELTIPF